MKVKTGGMNLAKSKDKDFKIPDHEIEALARCLLPEIRKFFESKQGQQEFAEWKTKKAVDSHKE